MQTACVILHQTDGTSNLHCQYACAAAREGAAVYPRPGYLAQDCVSVSPCLVSKLLFLRVPPRSPLPR